MRPLKPLERWGRRRISRILRALLVGGIEKRPLPPDPRSILVVRIDDRLGNLVLLEPLLTSLSERFPGARVELLASRTFADVFESHAAVSRIWRAEKKRYIRNPLALLLFFRRLRRCAFDVAIDASHPDSFSLSSAVASALAGADCIVGFPTPGSKGWYHASPDMGELDPAAHESRRLHHLGSLWDRWPRWRRPVIECEPDRSGEGTLIGFHVGASRRKGYTSGYVSRLMDVLRSKGSLSVYWGSGEELSLAEATAERDEIMPGLDLASLMSSISRLDAYVTADNGTLHLASALGVPVVGLFRVAGTERRYSPLSGGSSVLLDPEGPDPEEVGRAVERALERGRAGGASAPPSPSPSSRARHRVPPVSR